MKDNTSEAKNSYMPKRRAGFDFTKHEKIILTVLCFVLLAGIGFSFYRANLKRPRLTVESVCMDKAELNEIDEIIRSYSLVNINTAAASELQRLNGVGPVLAKRIVDCRQANGPFFEEKELLKVKGIGPKLYERVEKNISIE